MSDQQPDALFAGMFVVGITGHRDIGDPHAARVRQEAEQYFAALSKQHTNICVLSQLAVGADTILVESAQKYGARHIAVVPFARYEEDFTATIDLTRYHELREQSVSVHFLDYEEQSNEAYLEAGKWIVDHAVALLASWDGEDARDEGGTGDIVAYAHALKKPVFIIETPR